MRRFFLRTYFANSIGLRRNQTGYTAHHFSYRELYAGCCAVWQPDCEPGSSQNVIPLFLNESAEDPKAPPLALTRMTPVCLVVEAGVGGRHFVVCIATDERRQSDDAIAFLVRPGWLSIFALHAAPVGAALCVNRWQTEPGSRVIFSRREYWSVNCATSASASLS